MKKNANWNVKYIVNPTGRAFKISELSLKQTNSNTKQGRLARQPASGSPAGQS